jgi:hypothetical protein
MIDDRFSLSSEHLVRAPQREHKKHFPLSQESSSLIYTTHRKQYWLAMAGGPATKRPRQDDDFKADHRAVKRPQ